MNAIEGGLLCMNPTCPKCGTIQIGEPTKVVHSKLYHRECTPKRLQDDREKASTSKPWGQ